MFENKKIKLLAKESNPRVDLKTSLKVRLDSYVLWGTLFCGVRILWIKMY
jgi:hypothetical protein